MYVIRHQIEFYGITASFCERKACTSSYFNKNILQLLKFAICIQKERKKFRGSFIKKDRKYSVHSFVQLKLHMEMKWEKITELQTHMSIFVE